MRTILNKLFGKKTKEDEIQQKPDLALTPRHTSDSDLKSKINQALEENQYIEADTLLSEAIEAEPNNLSLRNNRAFVLLQLQRITDAEQELRAALAIDDKQVDTLFMLGGVLRAQGQLQEAAECFTNCVRLNPLFVHAYLDLARLQLQQNNTTQALSLLEEAAKKIPGSGDVDYLRAEILQTNEQLNDAITAYRAALNKQPELVGAHLRLGFLYQQTGDVQAAINSFESFIKQTQLSLELALTLGRLYHQTRQTDRALDYFSQALKFDKNSIEALAISGSILQEMRRLDEALQLYDRVVELDPSVAMAWHNKGMIAYDKKDFAGSLSFMEKAAALSQSDPNIQHHLGLALSGLERWEEAIACFDRALKLNPQHPFAYFDRGKTSLRLEKYDAALKDLEQALQVNPKLPEANLEIGFALLSVGELARGFKQYEWRWRCSPFKEKLRPFSKPAWDGSSPINGKRILLHAEQGLGDSIQFARYAQIINEMGAQAILEVQAPLVRLFEHLVDKKQVYTQGQILPEYDLHAPLMSLPYLCRTTVDSIPSKTSYYDRQELRSAARRQWQDKLRNSGRKKIGVVWAGSRDFVHDKKRSVPFEVFEKLLKVDADFICLQKEISDRDLVALEQHQIPFHGAELDDLLETAALISHMDLVITVDTSIAHLAGSIGVPVWIMLPFNPDWRWMLHRQDSPWYPSARLFRQKQIYQWHDVITEIEAELKQMISN